MVRAVIQIRTGSTCPETHLGWRRYDDMSDDDEIFEVESPSIAVPETRSIFRLVSKTGGRYAAIVAAETHEQARRFAAEADPFGAEWENPEKFDCVHSTDLKDHVVGDVVFQSAPQPVSR